MSGMYGLVLRDAVARWASFVGPTYMMGLRFKPACLMPSATGLSLCGLRIYPGTVKLGLWRRRSWRERRRHWERRYRSGTLGELELQHAYASLQSMTLPAQARGLRRVQLAREPAPGMESVF